MIASSALRPNRAAQPMRFALSFLIFLAALGAGRAQSALDILEIATDTGRHAFSVEVMRTEEERAKGLMFRRFLPEDRGMLFDFQTEQEVIMWMKNTYIPLDMVFIGKDGSVLKIAENTEPMSERIIPSGGPVRAVLEINAGMAARIGAKPGDRVYYPKFKQ